MSAETGMAADGRLPVTALVLAFNEELHIARCLDRLVPFCARVVVIDSFSTDRTAEIALAHGAEVLRHGFATHAEQLRWAMAAAAPRTPWVLRVDCDEYFVDGALAALGRFIAGLPGEVAGVCVRRRLIFRDRWIRHGGYYPLVLLRLWRTGQADVERRFMDEHVTLTAGRAAVFAGGDLVDHSLTDIGGWTDKQNRYATLAMADAIAAEYGLGAPETTGGRRRLRRSLYGAAPLYLRALLLFFYRYVLRLGFLDGRQGFLFHALHGFWLFLLIDAKIEAARAAIAHEGLEAFRRRMRAQHGVAL